MIKESKKPSNFCKMPNIRGLLVANTRSCLLDNVCMKKCNDEWDEVASRAPCSKNPMLSLR